MLCFPDPIGKLDVAIVVGQELLAASVASARQSRNAWVCSATSTPATNAVLLGQYSATVLNLRLDNRWCCESYVAAQLPMHAISLRAQPKSALISNGSAPPVVSHPSLPECLVSLSDGDQITARSAGGSPLSSSSPTSRPSGFRCNRSEVFASSSTLLLLTQYLVCCIDRLNPQPFSAGRHYGVR
jgi:hypothetical protein